MKKTISIMMMVAMLLCTASVLLQPAGAVVEGDWVTTRRANDYDDEQNYSTPAAGYEYTPDGFQTISPDYTNSTVYQQVHTRQAIDLKGNNDGQGHAIALTFTVLDYPYGGETDEDQWIAITLNSQEKANQGSVENGEGLCILIRQNVGGSVLEPGKAQAQYHYVDKDGKGFAAFTLPNITVPLNEEGKEIYSFTVTYDGTGYVFNLCGTETKDEYLNTLLDKVCADGAYLGITMHSGVSGATASMLISSFQGEVPFGDDRADPQPNVKNFAPIADSSTVEVNQPAVLWDSTCRDFDKIDLVGASYEVQENGTVKLTTQTLAPYLFMGVKSEISYEAADFPVIAILTKDCFANDGVIFYCAGSVLAAKEECSDSMELDSYSYGDGWALGIYDLSDDEAWAGRINAIRIGFGFSADDLTDEEYNNFKIAYYGAFRSEEEAVAYAEAYLTNLNGGELPTEQTTTEPEVNTTKAPDTDAPTTDDTDTKDVINDTEQPVGCKAYAAPIVALIAFFGAAYVIKKRG